MKIKQIIESLLEESIKQIGLVCTEIKLEIPSQRKNGDYSTNVALELKKDSLKNPLEIAKLIVDNVEENSIVEKIEIAGPGFINFFIKKDYYFKKINEIIKQDKDYGKSNLGNGKKINIEFVSANPTGILHVGTARGAAYGDSLARIYKFAGFIPTKEYYINDGGNQIENLGLSIKTRYENLCGINTVLPSDGYYGKEIIEIAENIYQESKDTKLKESNDYFKDQGIKVLMNRIKEDLKNFRVEFDIWTSEKEIRKSGKIEECLKILDDMGNIYEDDGAKWLRTSKYGDEKDRVIIKKDGTYTYIVPDIAYHLDKISRGYDKLIDVLGADHHGYLSRLKAAIDALGYDKNKLEIKLLQMVKLIKNGEEIKMSKRTGQTITISELIDEVGVDAARYFFSSKSLDTQMNFDITLATKKSNENPVYYIQYAHARICSILKNVNIKHDINEYKTITSDISIDLIKKVLEFESVVETAAIKQIPHIIPTYLYELAALFHNYYNNEKILSDDKIYTYERINLINIVKITIKNGLDLIGVNAFEEM
jgi:arginyl-tRNA synthetase